MKLDKDLSVAKLKWAKLDAIEVDDHTKSFANIVRFYVREVLPGKAPQTQKDNHKEIKKLLPVFGEMPIDQIEPQDVRGYLDLRGQTAKVRANREKALLSHIFNFARGKGFTAVANPREGIAGFTEKGRDIYVEDAQFKAVWEVADCALQDAMDLAYLTGQRPSDTLQFSETNIHDSVLHAKQRKTEQKLRIPIAGQLAEVIERIR